MVETPTILLVESNVDDAASFGRALSDLGATLWHVETGADARAVLKDARPDLIVLDLRLRDVDGLVLCSSLRHESAEVPFMICSSGTTAEKVLAFKLGAEDFVAKPYEAAELQARVEAILTRHARKLAAKVSAAERLTSAAQAGSWPDLGRLRVDLARWRVTVDDRPLNLTPTEFQLLVFMARRPGEIISRQELARGVWGNEAMSRSRTIDAYVRRIASKLSGTQKPAQGDGPPRILNIRGLGYQLSVAQMTAA